MPVEQRFRSAGLPLFQGFAEAQNDIESGSQGRLYFFVDERVGFAQLVAALAVSQDDVPTSEIEEHRRADLAGEGAFLFGIHVLSPSAMRLPWMISPISAR